MYLCDLIAGIDLILGVVVISPGGGGVMGCWFVERCIWFEGKMRSLVSLSLTLHNTFERFLKGVH